MGWLGPACAFMSSVTWAVGSTFYSRLSRDYSPFAVNFGRALVALPLFLVAAFVTAGGLTEGLSAYASLRVESVGWFFLSMVASYGLGDALFLWSAGSIGVPAALAIGSSYPVWTALAGWRWSGQSLTPIRWVGLLVTVVGVAVVILSVSSRRAEGELARGEAQARSGRGGALGGIAMAIGTSLMWALNSVAVARGTETVGAPVGNSIRMAVALGLCALLGRALVRSHPILMPARVFRSYLWLFVLEAFGGSYFFLVGFSQAPLAVAATLSSLAPALAVPFGWLMRTEPVSWLRLAGIGMVVGGVTVLLSN